MSKAVYRVRLKPSLCCKAQLKAHVDLVNKIRQVVYIYCTHCFLKTETDGHVAWKGGYHYQQIEMFPPPTPLNNEKKCWVHPRNRK